MDDFPGLLSGEFGLRPQGKSAPMAASRGGSVPGRSSDSLSSSASSNARSNRESTLLGDPMPMDRFFDGNSKQDYGGGGGFGDLDGIFLGGGSGSVNKRNSAAASSSASLGLDSVFDGFQDPTVKTTQSGPIFDKPVYDDDMFGGIPGLKTTSTGKFDDVFDSLSSASNHQHKPSQDDDILRDLSGKNQRETVSSRKQSENATWRSPMVDDDILGDLSGRDHMSSVYDRKQSADDVDKSMNSFNDLIPGFGSSSPPQKREYSRPKHQHSSSQSNKTETSVFDDPFVDLNTKSVPSQPSSGITVNPLDSFHVPSGKLNSDISSGLFDDGDIFNGHNKVMPPFSSELNDNQKYKSSMRTAQETILRNPHIAKESFEASINNFSDTSFKNVSTGSFREQTKTQFQKPGGHLETGASSGRFADLNLEKREDEYSHSVEDIWLTVSEVPLFTQPTNAPHPSRPPPPFRKGQHAFIFGDKGAYSNTKSKGTAGIFFQQRTQNNVSSEPFSDSPKTYGVSSVNELEDFAMGRRKAHDYEHSETVSSEEDNETSSTAAAAAAATAAALDNAEAKMKQAKELREKRESRNFKNMDFPHQVKKGNAMADFQNQEILKESDESDREQVVREREEKEKEKRRLERERERAAVERALQEVRERAVAEARERAVAEARQKAERAAVDKANAEARERAARAAVQKVTAEARERAAAEARERAAAEIKEKLAREAREREVKEREAREKVSALQRERERAAVQRATQDARLRAERAAVEKANREARERAVAAAREKLQKNENDLDSVFGMGSRATSEPKQRSSTPDVSFTQVPNRGDSNKTGTMSSASSSNMRKASSANFLDDLNSVFGAPPPSGEFQDIDGESEERRRARLERHQRTSERAAKALAEKNQRDMQVQMEQVERDRIAERLEVEIKRWAAGKQGNLRALLSTLQYVLWPECGWQAVSLTDLITSASVKKVYRKATLHIHPDKVQQKGANLEQKIIAEKVFDLLKEAWNKFNSEELF